MQPIVSSVIPNVITTPLINTAVPGSAIVHMPYDNVAPSVSSAQTDPNARGNALPPPEAERAPAATAPQAPFPNFLSNPAVGSSVQATFLAQLIAQDTSPQTAGILVQYEKLVAFSLVKYKPSNAMKPEAEPAGAFGKMLQAERAAPPRVETPPPPPPVHEQVEQVAAPRPVEPPRRQPKIETQAKNAPTQAPAAAGAYTSSIQRNNAGNGDIADLI